MQRFNRVRSARRSVWKNSYELSALSVESLESRTLLNATVTTQMPSISGFSSESASINLNSYFNDPTVVGTTVEIQTPLGNIPLELYSQTPNTDANFEQYITNGEYKNVIIHRSVPGFVIQGGGYSPSGTHITQLSPVQSEAGISNTTGTIAMALSTGPNSGTSEWFINLTDNSSLLDGTSDGGPFTVFGTVIYNGLQVADEIASLPVVDDTQATSPAPDAFSSLPVQSGTNGATVSSEPASNMVVTNTVIVPALTYTVTSDNTSVVNPTVSGNTLQLAYRSDGTANITVTATDLGSNAVSSTFAVSVTGAVGTIGKGAAHVLHFVDPSGVAGTATLTGPGTATFTFTGDGMTTSTSRAGVETITGAPQSITISTTGTTTASTLSITGGVSLAGISTDASIGSITASRATLAGGLSVAGTVGTINLDTVSGGTIAIDSAGRATALNVGSATGETLSSAGSIASITTKSWTSGAMSATAINRIADTGELNAQITAPTLGLVTAGSITSSTWAISGKLTGITAGSITGLNLAAGLIGPITDRGAAQADAITSTGNIGAITALSMSGTRIEAGVDSADANGLATAFSADDKIASVVIGRGGFSNSVIDAETLSRVSLGTLSSSNGGVPFGLASSDIVSLTATIDGKRVTLSRATSAEDVTAALAKAGVTLTDMVIRII